MFRDNNNGSTPSTDSFNDASSAAMEDDYQKAILELNKLPSNRKAQKVGNKIRYSRAVITSAVLRLLATCGIEQRDLEDKLSVIHVSGTKGKGSTCAYCESILRQYGYKTGFLSSPHLYSVRERIRINGEPLSREKFAEYFWSIHGKLKLHKERSPLLFMFMFMTVMAFKVFYEENVDVAILEVGLGGEYDCTNILSNTAVVGISSLGFDHVLILGNTIEEIAWHKAGIIKQPSVVVTAVGQPDGAISVLNSRAMEKSRPLYVAPDLSEYETDTMVELGIGGPVQRLNASLALQLVNAWMNPSHYHGEVQKAPTFTLSREMEAGLRKCSWPGRAQILQRSKNLSYYLDGAHTDESIQYCVDWFEQTASHSPSVKRVLVFDMDGDRDARSILKLFLPYRYDLACFCTDSVKSLLADPTHEIEDEERAEKIHRLWLELKPGADKNNSLLMSNVNEVHELMMNLAREEQLQVLVTGSLHLVGALLSILDSSSDESMNC